MITGQQVVEEILDAQRPACPPEYININIPENHTYRTQLGHTEMPVLRTRYDYQTGLSPNNPRQQVRSSLFLKRKKKIELHDPAVSTDPKYEYVIYRS